MGVGGGGAFVGVLAEAFADARLDTKTWDKDVKRFLTEVQKVAARAEKALNISADVDTSNATRAITTLQRQLKTIRDADVDVDVDTKQATAAVKALDTQLRLLDDSLNISADADTGGVIQQLTLLEETVGRLDGRDIDIDVDVDTGAAVAELEALEAATTRADDAMTRAGGGRGGRGGRGVLLLAIGLGAVAAAAAAAGGALGAFGVAVQASMEQVQVGFEGTLGSAERATEFIGRLEQFAAVTPFEFDQLTSSAQRLLGVFGKQFESELVPTLTIIGDVAAALGVSAEGIDRVTVALGQIQGKGKVMAQELQQISEAFPGFSAIRAIAQEMGVTVPQAFKQVELGAVDAETGIAAILEGMRKFPGAAGAMEKQSQTLIGRLSTLRDNLKIAARQGFEPLFLSVKGIVDDALDPLVAAFEKLAPSVNRAFLSIAPALFPFLEQLSEGFANVLDGLGPGLASVLRGLTPALEPLGEILGRVGEVTGATAEALLVGLTPALQVLASVLNAIPTPVLAALVTGLAGFAVANKAATAINAFNLAMKGLGTAGIGPISLALTGLSAVMVGVSAAFQANAEKQREIQQVTRQTSDALLTLTNAFLTTTDAANGFDPTATSLRLLGEALTDSGEDAEKLKDVLGTLGLTLDRQLVPTLARIATDGVGGVDSLGKSLRGAFNPEQVKIVLDMVDAFDGTKEVIGNTILELAKADPAFKGLTQEQEDLIRALEELQDQSEKTDLDAIVQATLNEAAASDEATKKLVEQAEATTGLSRSGEGLIPLYIEFLRLQGEVVSSTDDAASSYDKFGTSLGRASIEANKYSGEIIKTIEPFDQATAAASAFDNALNRLINRQLGVAGANTNLANTMGSIKETFSTTGLEGDALAEVQLRIASGFDIATQAGRDNQTLVQGAVGDILALASADLEAGAALDSVKASTLLRVEALKNELVAAGLSEEAVQAYIDTLGLTPSNIETTIEQTGADTATAEVEDYQKKLEEIDDKEYVALVKAQTDEASISAANRALDRLTEQRYANVIPVAGGVIRQFMAGGRLDLATPMGHDGAFMPAMVGEAGREIAWLPKGAEVLNNATTERLLQAMGEQRPTNRAPAPSVTRLHPQDIDRLADRLASMMPPLATIEVPYLDADAIASKIASRWRMRGF